MALRRALVLATLLAGRARASSSLEIDYSAWPLEGASGPHTYVADESLVSCALLDPYPDPVPWDPTSKEAMELCSGIPKCGGFLYYSAAANAANGDPALATATYCSSQTFQSGTSAATTAVGFARHLYGSCDLRVDVPTSTSYHHGVLRGTRPACARPGRGLSRHRTRAPRPNRQRHRAQPRRQAEVGGLMYVVGQDVFRDVDQARSLSVDGATHVMQTPGGVEYHAPGATAAMADLPFALDGYFPLYRTEVAAKEASVRGGGSSMALAVGPTTAYALPLRWSQGDDPSGTYYVPEDLSTTFLGTYVEAFSLDGYFPLFKTEAQAQAASSSGVAEAYGPGSLTGHPTWWSDGQFRLLYMPEEGHAKYFGNYNAGLVPGLYETLVVRSATRRNASSLDWPSYDGLR